MAKKKFVPKVAQICEILGNFGCLLPGNKDLNPCLEDPDFLSPAKKGQRVGSLNPNPWIRNNTTRNTKFYSDKLKCDQCKKNEECSLISLQTVQVVQCDSITDKGWHWTSVYVYRRYLWMDSMLLLSGLGSNIHD
jgi:hypothetical protein